MPSSSHAQSAARSGTIEARLFCATCWSNMTRLLNTPIIGRSATTVVSSWIDMLAGLSIMYCLRIPPCFCATAAPVATIIVKRAKNAVAERDVDAISSSHLHVYRGVSPNIARPFCPPIDPPDHPLSVRRGTERSVLDRHSPDARSANMILRLTGVPSQRNLITAAVVAAKIVGSPGYQGCS